MMEPLSGARLVGIVAIILFGRTGRAIADDLPLRTVLRNAAI